MILYTRKYRLTLLAGMFLFLFTLLPQAWAQTVNLNNYFTATPPSGAELKFYTGQPFGPATELPAATVLEAPPGTYYAVYKGISQDCFSPAQKITVTTNDCLLELETVDLTIYSAGVTAPAGAVLEWHNGLPASPSTLVDNPALVGQSGTYYAVFRGGSAGDECYSPASDPIIVVIKPCELPVTLISFSAATQEQATALSWTTTEETNSDRFEIERSRDAKQWARIGTKSSAGESKARLNYDFIDSSPVSGANYYRLKMIDKDATYTYSRIVQVNFAEGIAYTFPNPTSGLIKLTQPGLVNAGKVELIGTNGKVVYTASQMPADGINVKGLVSKGLYMLKVSHPDGSQSVHKIAITE